MLAAALLLVAVAIQWMLRPLVGERIPFLAFLPAVAIAAMWLGWHAALVVFAGGLVSATYWLDPAGPQALNMAEQVALAGYTVASIILTAMGERVNTLRRRAMDAERILSRQVRDLQSLQELAGRVMLMTDVHAQFSAILEALVGLLGTPKAFVSLYDAQTDTLRAAASTGFTEGGRRTLESIPNGAGACGAAFKERRPVLVTDTETDERFAQFRVLARDEGFRSVLSHPLVTMQGERIGVLSVHFAKPRRPTESDSRITEFCAQMASVLAERHMLVEEATALSHRVEIALGSSAVPFCLLQPVRDEAGELIDFRWEYLNGAAAHALRHGGDDLGGRSVRDVLPAAWEEPGLLRRFLDSLEQNATVEFEIRVGGNPGRPWYHIIVSPCEGGLAVWFSDITERKYQEQLLRDADRRKDEFLATLAHELRNPLAPIRQAAMIARSPSAKPDQRRWSLEVIDRQVSHMAVLLDDLLDVSRITRGKLELRRAVTDLRQVVDAALESTRPAIEARKQHLNLDWPAEPLWANVDAMRISQVISNLLTNACKYTPPEGSIWLTGRHEGGEVVIEVRDNGIGIPPDSLERVFEMFTQLRNPQVPSTVGLGIGLALSRGLAHMHGASLTAHSEGIGHGSTFVLRLPLCSPPAAPAARPLERESGTRTRRILVADDNRDAAESLAEVLRMDGHEVVLAFDGEQALRKFMEVSPDVALLDIGMPGMTGNEVAQAIRAEPAGEHTMLVAITGWGQERDRAAARAAGFDYHFTKPVDPQKLAELIADPAAARSRLALGS